MNDFSLVQMLVGASGSKLLSFVNAVSERDLVCIGTISIVLCTVILVCIGWGG